MKRLARDLGISHTYISHIERGKAQPSESLIRKFAAYFGVDEEDLLFPKFFGAQVTDELMHLLWKGQAPAHDAQTGKVRRVAGILPPPNAPAYPPVRRAAPARHEP